jgi:hypothetical protein
MNSYRRCAVCGKTYLVSRPGQIVCADDLCQQVVLREAQAIRTLRGERKEVPLPVRDERKLALAEKRGQSLRKCHDCGRPTTDFRCPSCRNEWRVRNGLAPVRSVYDEEDYNG